MRITLSCEVFVFAPSVSPDNMKVKRGTTILVGCHNLQRDPAYYEDPEMFKPERFLAERTIEINSPYTFVPFR